MGHDPRVVPAQLTDALLALRRGDLTLDQFKGATSPEAVQRWLAATQQRIGARHRLHALVRLRWCRQCCDTRALHKRCCQ